MILFYSNDIENRTFKLNSKEYKKEIFYDYENLNFEKKELYFRIKEFSNHIFDIIYKNKENPQIMQLLKFLFYLDNKFYIELLTVIFISLPEYFFDAIKFNKEMLEKRKLLLNDNFMKKEVRTIRNIFGFI